MKKIIFLLFIFSSLSPVFAVGVTRDSTFERTTTDTIPFVIEEDEIAELDDSLESLPAFDLYCGFDTVNMHSVKFNIESLADNIKEIALYDKNSCGYVHPFSGKVTSGFGPRKRRYHYGADIDLETGDCVVAAFDGRVRIAKLSKSYGNVIVIRHSNGLETYYAHLSKINVEVGEEIYAGQTIGLGGNTGRSRGSHLHFEVRYLGQPINPTELISFTEHKLVADTLCLSKKTFDYVAEAKKAASKNYASSKKGRIYVVKKGDTLYAIAKRHKTTPKALSQKNRLKSKSVLKAGQRIKI